MKRLVLLLPLLLLANSMPTGATQQKTAEVLLRQTIEIQDELKVMLKEAQASGDQCGSPTESPQPWKCLPRNGERWRLSMRLKET